MGKKKTQKGVGGKGGLDSTQTGQSPAQAHPPPATELGLSQPVVHEIASQASLHALAHACEAASAEPAPPEPSAPAPHSEALAAEAPSRPRRAAAPKPGAHTGQDGIPEGISMSSSFSSGKEKSSSTSSEAAESEGSVQEEALFSQR